MDIVVNAMYSEINNNIIVNMHSAHIPLNVRNKKKYKIEMSTAKEPIRITISFQRS